MSLATERAKLVKVKTALADKYTHLASVVKSKPRSATWSRLAAKFRRQAEDLKRLAQE